MTPPTDDTPPVMEHGVSLWVRKFSKKKSTIVVHTSVLSPHKRDRERERQRQRETERERDRERETERVDKTNSSRIASDGGPSLPLKCPRKSSTMKPGKKPSLADWLG